MIEIKGVNKSFPTKDGTVAALDNVELEIGKGDFVSIVGPSGCGKSTLMMCIAGLAQPTEGTIEIDKRPVTGPVTDVGIVFQDALLLDWRNVLENVLFQIEMRGLRKADYRDGALQLLKQVG